MNKFGQSANPETDFPSEGNADCHFFLADGWHLTSDSQPLRNHQPFFPRESPKAHGIGVFVCVWNLHGSYEQAS